MMHMSNVGTAPGTTVLRIPATAMMARGMGLGTVYPTDFDRAKQYDYLPYTTGWIPGRLDVQPALAGFGAMTADEMESRIVRLEEGVVVLQTASGDMIRKLSTLEVSEREEAARTQRWNRRANAIIAIAALGGLAVSILSLSRGR